MKRTRTLLVSGIGKRNALLELMTEECNKRDITLYGADSSNNPPARLSIDHFVKLPRADSPHFLSSYISIVKELGAAAGFTLIDPEIPFLGHAEKHFSAGEFASAHPVPESATICEDKYAFSQHMLSAGVNAFESYLRPPDQYPIIRKDRRGSAASGFKLIQSESDWNDEPGEFIYQKYCGGDHYCVDAYFSVCDGALIDFCVKRILNKSKGESFLLESMPRSDFSAILQSITRVVPLRGIVNFDFLDDSGVMRVLEVNCRIGGNYPVSHALGCNLIGLALDEVFDGKRHAPNLKDYALGKVVAKYFAFTEVFDKNRLSLT